jgi:hypothetical protein
MKEQTPIRKAVPTDGVKKREPFKTGVPRRERMTFIPSSKGKGYKKP